MRKKQFHPQLLQHIIYLHAIRYCPESLLKLERRPMVKCQIKWLERANKQTMGSLSIDESLSCADEQGIFRVCVFHHSFRATDKGLSGFGATCVSDSDNLSHLMKSQSSASSLALAATSHYWLCTLALSWHVSLIFLEWRSMCNVYSKFSRHIC